MDEFEKVEKLSDEEQTEYDVLKNALKEDNLFDDDDDSFEDMEEELLGLDDDGSYEYVDPFDLILNDFSTDMNPVKKDAEQQKE